MDAEWNSVARGFSDSEIEIFIRIVQCGLFCFRYFNLENFENSVFDESVVALAKEERDSTLEGFASIFKSIEPSAFQEVWESQLDYFFQQCILDPHLLAIPQYFLVTSTIPSNFSGLLLCYLLENMDKLGGPTTELSSVLMKMFNVLFLAVLMFPEKNEPMLIHHISNFVLSVLKCASKSQEPLNYFLILRSLFRAISGDKFDKLHSAVLPLLPILLETLNQLLDTAQTQSKRDLFVELCLTVPFRLTYLLPYLHLVMRPLVIGLRGGPELVAQGLRMLEVCIDNLTHEFLVFSFNIRNQS